MVSRIPGPSVNALLKVGQWQQALNLVLSNPSPRDISKVLHTCARKRQWQHCLTLLNLSDPCTIVDVNVTLNALARVGSWQHAVQLYNRASRTDVVSFNSTLHALTMSEWRRALKMLTEEKNADVISYNTVLSARGLPWECALGLLQKMDTHFHPTLISYNAVLHSLTCGGQWVRALNLLKDMHNADAISVATVISGTPWEIALELLHTHGYPQAAVNAALHVCAKSGRWENALSLLDTAQTNTVSYNTTLRALAVSRVNRGQAWLHGWRIFHRMLEKRLDRTHVTYSSLIMVMEKSRRWEEARKVYQRACDDRKVNLVVYNSLLSALEKGNQWVLALQILCDSSVKPDVISFSSVLSAMERGGAWQQALLLLDRMQAVPNVVTYNAVLSALARGVTLQAQEVDSGPGLHATRLVEKMRSTNVDADVITYNAAIGAYGMDWVRIWELFRHMRKSITPDALTYHLAIRGMRHCSEGPLQLIVDEGRQQALDWARTLDYFGADYDIVRLAQTLQCDPTDPFVVKVRERIVHPALRALQESDHAALERAGLPNFGLFTREALDSLGIEAFHTADKATLHSACGVRARDVVAHMRCMTDGKVKIDRTVQFGSAPCDLPFLYLNHDRSFHAERHALSQIIGFEGVVELYVTHRPCISCIAAMVGFQRSSPKALLKVTFGELDHE